MDPSYVRQMAALQSEHWWYDGRRQILISYLDSLKLEKSSTLILDAGCGPGSNLTALSFFGDVKAFEPDEYSCNYASTLSGLEVRKGALPASIPYEENFDVVCAFDVIEHVEHDVAALKSLCDKLKPGGHGLFTVPAHMWLWSEHDIMNHHYKRYNLKNFRAALENAGFEIEKISYYNMWLFPLAASVRLIKKLLKINDHKDTEIPPKILNTILCNIFSSEAKLLHKYNLPFGLSIIAHCKKNT